MKTKLKVNPRVVVLRQVVERVVQILSKRQIPVTQRGTTAFVEWDQATLEPKRVNIPSLPDDASDELIEAIEGYIDHEVGHLLDTDPKATKVATLEQQRTRSPVNDMRNLIEDARIEKRQMDRFRGSAYNLANVGQFVLGQMHQELGRVTDQKQREAMLMMPAVRAWAGQELYRNFLEDGGYSREVQPIADKIGPDVLDKIARVTSNEDSLQVAREVIARMKSDGPPPPPSSPPQSEPGDSPEEQDEEEGDEPEQSGQGEAEPQEDSDQSPDEGEPQTPERPAEEDEEGEAEESPSDDEGDGPEQAQQGDDDEGAEQDKAEQDEGEGSLEDSPGPSDDPADERGQDDGPGEIQPDATGSDDAEGEPLEEAGQCDAPTSQNYEGTLELMNGMPDFDEMLEKAIGARAYHEAKQSKYAVFTRDEDTIEPIKVDQRHFNGITRMQDEVDSMVGPMARNLERLLLARAQDIMVGGFRRGRLNGAALTRIAFGYDDVFQRRQENLTKSVAIQIGVDESGSMGLNNKIETASYTAYAMCMMLERLGIPCEALSFTDKPYSHEVMQQLQADPMAREFARLCALRLSQVKAFGERMTAEVKARFVELSDSPRMRSNVDGESLMMMVPRLLARPEERKVLIVNSDGRPASTGPGDFDAHLRASVKTIEALGVEVIAIGICDDSVRHFYKNNVVINSVSDLPAAMLGKMKQILMHQ